MPPVPSEEPQAQARLLMVWSQIEARGVRDPRVLEALRRVPRHAFVPPALAGEAHGDHPLPIGLGQTISQPYIVAFMAEALGLRGPERVLEVGAGSGYMAAVLGHLAADVQAVELEEILALPAADRLARLGIRNVRIHVGDGSLGWPAGAPYDAIVLSCATPEIPPALLDQLAPDGRMVLPLGAPRGPQELVRVRRTPGGLQVEALLAVAFVPLRQAAP